ncbi:MAG: DUF2062 domain-containing protein [Burkholderiales bacterium]
MSRAFIRRWLPDPEKLRSNRGLRWLGPLLNRASLWHVNRKSVARGFAIGIFFGLLAPIAQILFAGIAAFALRANLPVAALATLISNPFTIVPLYILAYHVGVTLLGYDANETAITSMVNNLPSSPSAFAAWMGDLAEAATPLFAGLATMAVAGAVFGYMLVQALWIAPAVLRTARRRTRKASQQR